MPREREFDWKPSLFKAVVLHISEQLADDPTFGSTKLNKILYFSDTDAYLELGEPITGAVYQRNYHGPTAVEYPPMIDEMQGQDLVTVKSERVVDHVQDVVVPTRQFTLEMHLSDEQRRILDNRIAEFRGYTNTESSDRSHERSAGWLTRELGETIPYVSSVINPEPLDPHVLAGLKTKIPA
jgi:hypothetical protein